MPAREEMEGIAMKYKAVIFDMDGVLVDSESKYADTVSEFFSDVLRVSLTREQRLSVIGASSATNARHIKEWFPDLPYSEGELLHMYAETIFRTMRERVDGLIDGLDEWLGRLRTLGIKTAVATSSPRRVAQYACEKFDLARRMDAVVCGDDITEAKPNPEIFLLAAERIGVEPASCLVIEDSQNGIDAAKAAGMGCAAFTGAQSLLTSVSGMDTEIKAYDSETFERLFL